jgi:hypothetical protein
LFDGCDAPPDFSFQDATSALAAANALFDQVFLDGPPGQFDSSSALTNGCTTGIFSSLTPFQFPNSLQVTTAQATNDFNVLDGAPSIVSINLTTDTFPAITLNYARWSLSQPVPLPNALPLFALALVGLGWRMRRRTKGNSEQSDRTPSLCQLDRNAVNMRR